MNCFNRCFLNLAVLLSFFSLGSLKADVVIEDGELYETHSEPKGKSQLTSTQGKIEKFVQSPSKNYVAFMKFDSYVDSLGLFEEEKSWPQVPLFHLGVMEVRSKKIVATLLPPAGYFFSIEGWTQTDQLLINKLSGLAVDGYLVFDPKTKILREVLDEDFKQLKASSVSAPTHANSATPYICRNGLFPSKSEFIKLYRFEGSENEKFYFFDDMESCQENKRRCRLNAYVVSGDELLINKTQRGWACAWYQGKKRETVGWVKSEKLKELNMEVPTTSDWIGKWKATDSWVKITKNKHSSLMVAGSASGGDDSRRHEGSLDGEIIPDRGQATMNPGIDEYECMVKFVRIGRYLIVDDNGNCGGANVSFDNVYLRDQ